MRTRVTRPSPSSSKFTRWPWRSMRNSDPRERVRSEHELGAVRVADDEALPGLGIEDAHDALHQGFWTLPAFRQEVHTWMRFGVPFTMARTRCTFGFQRRFVRRCEWLSRIPNRGALPQTSHTEAIAHSSIGASSVPGGPRGAKHPEVPSAGCQACPCSMSSMGRPWPGSSPATATRCAAHQDELNRLNVYPVPDGDTGTNMTLTLESVCAELGGAERMDDVCRAVAHGSLMGARGNSGVILSQILRGLRRGLRRS